MYGSDDLFQALYNDAGVQALVSTYVRSTVTKYMVFTDAELPDDIVENDSVTINLYLGAGIGVDNTLEYEDSTFTVNCRGPVYSKVTDLAQAVIDAVNRVHGDSLFYTTNQLPLVPPSDSTDNYLVPVEVRIRTRR